MSPEQQSAIATTELKQVPIMVPKQFSDLTGIPKSTVKNMMDRDELPYIALGEGSRPRRFINLDALRKQCETE